VSANIVNYKKIKPKMFNILLVDCMTPEPVIAEKLGVSLEAVEEMIHDPGFIKEMKEFCDAKVAKMMPGIHQEVAAGALAGDYQKQKLFYDILGLKNPDQKFEFSLDMTMDEARNRVETLRDQLREIEGGPQIIESETTKGDE